MPREGQIRLCENYSSQIGRLPDTTRCLQIAVQSIQINQQDTVILGEGAGRGGEDDRRVGILWVYFLNRSHP